VERKSDYINWVFSLEDTLKELKIELSDYDEFHIREAIEETEKLIEQQMITNQNIFTEKMIDEYMTNAIKKEPSKRDYYETISYYVKKRLLPH
jgi:hypothetical protein